MQGSIFVCFCICSCNELINFEQKQSDIYGWDGWDGWDGMDGMNGKDQFPNT